MRLAKGMGWGSSASKQRKVLIRKLCLKNGCDEITDEDLQMYVQLFSQPLTQSQIATILALFFFDN